MLGLLRAQRAEIALRSTFARESPEWIASCRRLDDLNDRIMYLADFDIDRFVAVGEGIQIDLDSRPVEDVPFRRQVVDAVRQAVAVVDREDVALRVQMRVEEAGRRAQSTQRVIRAAEAALRRIYPSATIRFDREPIQWRSPESGEQPEPILSLRADREGRAA
jgi:hypothetical protein